MHFKLFHGLLLQLAVTDAVNIPSDSSNRVSLAKKAEVLSNLPLQAFITHYPLFRERAPGPFQKCGGGGHFGDITGKYLWRHRIYREIGSNYETCLISYKISHPVIPVSTLRNWDPGLSCCFLCHAVILKTTQ